MELRLKNRLLFKSQAESAIGSIIESAVAVDAGWTSEPAMRILGSYAMVYILDGKCRYVHADGRVQDFVAGDLLMIFPDVPHRYGPAPGCRWSQFYINYTGPAADLWRQRGLLDPDRFVYHLQPLEYWFGRFLSMVEAWPVANPFSVQPVCSLQALLSEIIESQRRSAAERKNVAWLQQAYERLAAVDTTPLVEMQTIAEQMGMSYTMFRKKFKALAGMSPGHYHSLLVMRRACQWMHEEALASKEIADRLGFCNAFHFSHRFKQVIGMTPRQYRMRLKPPGAPAS